MMTSCTPTGEGWVAWPRYVGNLGEVGDNPEAGRVPARSVKYVGRRSAGGERQLHELTGPDGLPRVVFNSLGKTRLR